MRWKRRKPLWPLLGALCCLFALAVAAPLSWQGTQTNALPRLQKSTPPASQPEAVVLQPQYRASETLEVETPPALPPLKAALPVQEELVVNNSPLTLEPLPVPREFNLETLLQMRDVLRAAVDCLQEIRPEQTPVADYEPARVRVSSPNDRLAMVPPRRQTQVSPTMQTPAIDDFANELLQASRAPQAVPTKVPQVALRSKVATKPRTETQTEPQMESVEVPARPAALRTRPKQLIEQLTVVADKPPQADWAIQALDLIEQLASQPAPIHTEQILTELQQHADAGIDASNPILQPEAVQAALALQRRLGIWRVLLSSTPTSTAVATDAPSAHSEQLMPCLGEIASLLADETNGADWRNYLLLDRLAASTSEGLANDVQGRRKLAQEALSRMEDTRLTEKQQEFLATEPLATLHRLLKPMAAGPVDLELLDALVERYESGREVRYAVAIAKLGRRMQWSTDVRLQSLAKHLDDHYRGANMRIAITDDLMNRMIPRQKAIVTPVRERIAGAKVRGKSRTTTQVRVRLLPDTKTWRFVLEAFGKVYSETRSETWPARVQNAAKMKFQARKLIVINQEGMSTSPAKAQAQGRNDLLGVDSQLDPVPLVGLLLRDIARKKHHESRPLALRQVKSKVAKQARTRMDKETNPKLERLEQQFRAHVLAPIGQLALLAEPLNMHTTAERAVMNVRLANREQLAAHTPRPFAPADSLVSMQMHETALNNAIAGLQLDGRRMTMAELFEYFTTKFGSPDTAPPADMPLRAVLEFAARDAVRIKCEGDRLELIFGIKELSKGRDKIKNFEVHAFFRPVMNGLEVRLVRDGSLQFAGRRLKTGPRVVLHSIIGKLLPKGQEVGLLRAGLEDDPRLAGLMVTQLEITDGWIALALGPAHAQRTTWRTPEQRLLSTPFVR